MAIVQRRAGDDIPVKIGLTDLNTNPIDIDALAELYVYIIHSRSGSILAKFNKAGTGGFLALERISATSYRADIKSGLTKVAALGEYKIDVNVVQTDADYESSQKNTIGIEEVFNLNNSTSKIVSSG